MSATVTSPLKHPALHRSLAPANADMPKSVAQWILDNYKLNEADQSRLTALYNKLMDYGLSDEESQELDGLCEVATLLDIMRVKAVIAVR